MKLFHNKKVVDEREQMEMFRVEHYMYWLAFWALLAADDPPLPWKIH